MAWVTISGFLKNHRDMVKPPELQQRLFLKPNRGRVGGPGALDDERVYVTRDLETGAFSAEVFSDPGTDLYYTLCTDWLVPDDPDTIEERTRGYYEWPERIYPDVGGRIDDLVDAVHGVGLVYVSSAVNGGMSPIPRYQLFFNPNTGDVFERRITW